MGVQIISKKHRDDLSAFLFEVKKGNLLKEYVMIGNMLYK